MADTLKFTWICSGQNKYIRMYTFDTDPATIDPSKKLLQEDLQKYPRYEYIKESTENYQAALIVGGIKSENVAEYLSENHNLKRQDVDRLIHDLFKYAPSARGPEEIFKELAFNKTMTVSEKSNLIDEIQGEFIVKLGRAISGRDIAPPGDVKKVSDGFRVWAAHEEKECLKPASKSTKKSSSTS